MNTIADLLRQAAGLGLERLDAQLLLLAALGRDPGDRAWLIAHDEQVPGPDARERFVQLCRRRAAGEPAAYLLGSKEFFGLQLEVDARVLVPRPDTEIVVEWALQLMEGRPRPRVIDLGTGSGAIALAIGHRRGDAQVEAVDSSAPALEVARANARRLGVAVAFRHAHWLDGAGGPYDLVVANPPYIPAADPHLARLAHEPSSALVAGADGLDAIREIVASAPGVLATGGWLLLEHGYDQAAPVRQLLAQAGFAAVESRRDLAGMERCSGGQARELG